MIRACSTVICFYVHALISKSWNDDLSRESLLHMRVSDAQEDPPGNVFKRNVDGVGTWGGKCTCPDGVSYWVGDNNDACGTLACVNGKAGQCSQHTGNWSKHKVVCYVAPAPEPVPSIAEAKKMINGVIHPLTEKTARIQVELGKRQLLIDVRIDSLDLSTLDDKGRVDLATLINNHVKTLFPTETISSINLKPGSASSVSTIAKIKAVFPHSTDVRKWLDAKKDANGKLDAFEKQITDGVAAAVQGLQGGSLPTASAQFSFRTPAPTKAPTPAPTPGPAGATKLLELKGLDYSKLDAGAKDALADGIKLHMKKQVAAGSTVQVALEAGSNSGSSGSILQLVESFFQSAPPSVEVKITVIPPTGTSVADLAPDMVAHNAQIQKDLANTVETILGVAYALDGEFQLVEKGSATNSLSNTDATSIEFNTDATNSGSNSDIY